MKRIWTVSLMGLLLSTSVSGTPQNSELKKQDLPCPSIVRKFPNLDLKDISSDALPYLRKYSLPAADGAAFCRYVERIQHEHEAKVEEGLLDMMGDYFLTTQKIETGYYLSYKIGYPDRQRQQVILDHASSESEQVDLFLRAIDLDSDHARRELFEKWIKNLSVSNRREGALKLIHLLFEKSWVFNPAVQQYLVSESYHDDSYGFVDRGLRTTSYAHMGTTLDFFLHNHSRPD